MDLTDNEDTVSRAGRSIITAILMQTTTQSTIRAGVPGNSVRFARSHSSSSTEDRFTHPSQNTSALSPSFQLQPPSDPSTSTAAVPINRGIANLQAHATPPPLTRMMSSNTMVGQAGTGHTPPADGSSATGYMSGMGSPNFSSGGNTPTPMMTSLSDQGQDRSKGTPGSSLSHSVTFSSRSGGDSAESSPQAHMGTHHTSAHSTPAHGHAQGPAHGEKSTSQRAKDAAGAAARSFRVTLDDPCYKVLPAALKKYKINDDWKQYAMFICYANTGECERALMLTLWERGKLI